MAMANQFGLLVAFLLACACLTYLANAGWKFKTNRRRFSLWGLLVLLTLGDSILGLMIGLPQEDTSGGRPHRFDYFQLVNSENADGENVAN